MNEEGRGCDGNKKQKLQCGRVARGEKPMEVRSCKLHVLPAKYAPFPPLVS